MPLQRDPCAEVEAALAIRAAHRFPPQPDDFTDLPRHGLNAAAIREVIREMHAKLEDSPPEGVVGLALALADHGSFEGRHVSFELLARRKDALRLLGAAELERMGERNDNWASVDGFACYVSGRVWREGGIADATVSKWAASRNRWWRRTALVSTVPLNQKSHGGTGDPERTLQVCRALLDDRDDMVVKALSWALRALIPRDAPAVQRFVEEYDSRIAARVRREVLTKLRTGRKTRPRGG